MCLITKQTEPHIATEDIIVYKVVNKEGVSAYVTDYKPINYKIGAAIKHTIGRSAKGRESYMDNIVHFHYGLVFTPSFSEGLETLGLIAYGKGIHIVMDKYRGKDLVENTSYRELLQCIIPKGAKYFTDETGLGITECLIVVEEVK